MYDLQWIQQWYQSQCNGVWEHKNGITIETLDNPGWLVKIDLASTGMEEKSFEKIFVDLSDEDWISCQVQNGQFVGRGGPFKLGTILHAFKTFVQNNGD